MADFTHGWEYWRGPAGELIYVSPSCERITGYTREEFLRDPDLYLRIVHPTDRERIGAHLALDTLTSEAQELEFRIVRRDGGDCWIGHVCQPVIDAEGHFRGRRGSNRDITERKEAEESLRLAAEELARSNADLEQFAYVASHDLQEPLRIVTGFVQLLQQKYGQHLDAKGNEYIEFAVDATKRMQSLIQDLLAYSRVGTRAKEFGPTDSSEAFDRAVTHLGVSIRESGAEITHGELPTVVADGAQLVQLFQNLIGNALKFRGDAPPKVHVDACREQQWWHFSVHDNGIGIEPEYFERIFQIFQRLHSRKRYAGTGIGLAICHKIVERHGGQIWVESLPGQGATFHFTMPAAPTQ